MQRGEFADDLSLAAPRPSSARSCSNRSIGPFCPPAAPLFTQSSGLCPFPPLLLRLIGLAGMGFAIGRTGLGRTAAEMEFLAAGSPIGQRHMRSEMVSTVAKLPSSSCSGSSSTTGAAGTWARSEGALGDMETRGRSAARRAGPARQAQPVDLADHGIAGDPAQGAGDLAGRQAFGPKRLELLNPVVGPVHRVHGKLLARQAHSLRATRYRTAAQGTNKRWRGSPSPCPQDELRPDLGVPRIDADLP